MKSITTLAVLLLALCASTVQAARLYMPGCEMKVIEGQHHTSSYLFVDNAPTKGLGTFGMASVGYTYAQLYAGPTVKYNDLVEAGLGIGLERDNTVTRMRYAAFVFATVPFGYFAGVRVPVSVNYVNERSHGPSSPDSWSRFELFAPVYPNSNTSVGVTMQSKLGGGPRIGYAIPKLHAKIWTTAPYNGEYMSSISSVVFTF